MKPIIRKGIYIAIVPVVFLLGLYLGSDIQMVEAKFWQSKAAEVAKIYEERLSYSSDAFNACLDVNAGKLSPKEGEAKMVEALSKFNENDKRLDEFNAGLEAR